MHYGLPSLLKHLANGVEMMAAELDIPGKKAFELLSNAEFQSQCLYGAVLYDANRDEEIPVLGWLENTFKVDGPDLNFSWLKVGERQLIITKGLDLAKALLEALKSPMEIEREELSQRLRKTGLAPSPNLFSLDDLRQLVACTDAVGLPNEAMRSAFFDIIKRTDSYVWADKFFSRWTQDIEAVKGRPDPLSRIHLSTVLRRLGKLDEAIKVTNVVEFSPSKFRASPSEISILCTVRGATLMDIYERHNDPGLLRFTRLSLGKAWANAKAEHVSAAYHRLDKLEAERSAIEYRERINHAYAMWSDWTR